MRNWRDRIVTVAWAPIHFLLNPLRVCFGKMQDAVTFNCQPSKFFLTLI